MCIRYRFESEKTGATYVHTDEGTAHGVAPRINRETYRGAWWTMISCLAKQRRKLWTAVYTALFAGERRLTIYLSRVTSLEIGNFEIVSRLVQGENVN